jgi:hypothetical protein
MDAIDLENSINYTDNSCYRFNSRIAALLEKNHKWKDAMLQWIFVVQLAKHLENKVWAYQRALYCRITVYKPWWPTRVIRIRYFPGITVYSRGQMILLLSHFAFLIIILSI